MEFMRFLLVGLLSGWIVGRASRGEGYGLFGNLFVGAIGSVVGGYLFGFLGLSAQGILGSLIMAVVGALTFLFLLRLIKPAKKKRKKSEEDDDE